MKSASKKQGVPDAAAGSLPPRSTEAATLLARACQSFMKAAGHEDVADALARMIELWLNDAKAAAIRTRRTSGCDEDCSVLLRALGFAGLVECMTEREQAVLLNVLPHIHRIAHHGPSLAASLQSWLGVPVRYASHVPRSHVIPSGDRSRLSAAHCQLGRSLVLGGHLVEHRSVVTFEVDLRAESALEHVLRGGWAEMGGRQARPAKKLDLLSEHLISASLHVEWRWLLPEIPVEARMRLGIPAQSRLGVTTRLQRTPSFLKTKQRVQ